MCMCYRPGLLFLVFLLFLVILLVKIKVIFTQFQQKAYLQQTQICLHIK